MLHKIKSIIGFKLDCLDGDLGTIREFFFDDHHWTIRYLVANTGSWLHERRVLISPQTLDAIVAPEKRLVVGLTKKQIEDSPSLNSDKPVSRQFEDSLYGYYGMPMYWVGQDVWGASPNPLRHPQHAHQPEPGTKPWDPHLRSTADVTGHIIQATDGEIGMVEDFVIDDDTWTIRYLVIDTRSWWPGRKVLVSPRWIDHISWKDSAVFVHLTREAIRASPEYREATQLTREYEANLHLHYQRPGYWLAKDEVSRHSAC